MLVLPRPVAFLMSANGLPSAFIFRTVFAKSPDTLAGRPNFTPLRCAALMPSCCLSRIISRSNSATPARIVRTNLPVLLLVGLPPIAVPVSKLESGRHGPSGKSSVGSAQLSQRKHQTRRCRGQSAYGSLSFDNRRAEQGISFEQLIDDIRKDLAMRYLDEGKVKLQELAFLLGFSTHASFTSAFKRWTGKTTE